MSPVEPPEAWAAYADNVMHLAFTAVGGQVTPAVSGMAAIKHDSVSGRLLVIDRAREIEGLIRASPTPQALCEVLKKNGFDVRRTPFSALAWALPHIERPTP